jgi:hypothetical protein
MTVPGSLFRYLVSIVCALLDMYFTYMIQHKYANAVPAMPNTIDPARTIQ